MYRRGGYIHTPGCAHETSYWFKAVRPKLWAVTLSVMFDSESELYVASFLPRGRSGQISLRFQAVLCIYLGLWQISFPTSPQVCSYSNLYDGSSYGFFILHCTAATPKPRFTVPHFSRGERRHKYQSNRLRSLPSHPA